MRKFLILAALLGLPAAAAQPAFESRLFAPAGDVPLGAAAGRIDYQSIDNGRLYVSLMGAGKLLVFDLAEGRIVKQVDGFPKTTGVLAVGGRVYSSVPGAGLASSLSVGLGMLGLSSGHGAVVVTDAVTLRPIARLPGGVFPDGLTMDGREHRLFVSDEMGRAITAIDTDSNKVIARIAAGGEVGNVRYVAQVGRLYAPIQSQDALGVFDPARLTRLALWKLPGCRHPHGMAIAPEDAQQPPIGYVACDENDVLLSVDLTNGKVLSHLPVGHDPDVLALDAAARRLYVAGEAGVLSAYDISVAGAPVALGDTLVGPNAHSVAVDPSTHKLYLPLEDVNGRAVLRILAPKS